MSRRKTLRGRYRRLAAVLAVVMLLTVLSACGAEKQGETVYVPPESSAAPSAEPAAAQAEAKPKVTDAEQRQLISQYADLWTVKDSAEPWFYAITDLDHNGRLEVIAASTQGTGLFTYANFYEVSEDYSQLVPCETSGEEWESWPDLIQESLPCYYDGASGRYAYVCEDMLRNGAAYYDQTLTAIWLENGRVQQEPLANMTTEYTDPDSEPKISYQDAEGKPITREEYENWADRAFAGMEKSTLTLFWSEEPPQASAETDAASPADTENAVVITKNPRSEYIAEGGHTWFIAHAENAESIHWQVVDPDGTVYTLEEAMEKHPGLQLQELELDTIGVSDIPLSADGWGVQAVFEGPGGTAVTEPAYLYVS